MKQVPKNVVIFEKKFFFFRILQRCPPFDDGTENSIGIHCAILLQVPQESITCSNVVNFGRNHDSKG